MSKQRNQTSCFVSFDMETHKKVEAMARMRELNKSEFIRRAVIDFIKRNEQSEAAAQQRELEIAEQLKKSTNRICSLLAKTAIDINSVARYIWETVDDDGKNLYEDCHEKAVRRVKQRVSRAEQEIIEAMTAE